MLLAYRIIVSIVAWCVLAQTILYLFVYRRAYWDRGTLPAPLSGAPVRAYFIQYAGMTGLVFSVAVGNIYSAAHRFPFNPVSLISLPSLVILGVGLWRTGQYIAMLAEWEPESLAEPGESTLETTQEKP